MSNELQSLVHVVDDDESMRVLVGRWLENGGFEPCPLSGGEKCLESLAEEVPAAICLDMNMPGMGGLETLERIRQHHPVLPIVVLTADDSAHTAVSAMKLGAYDYLTKPLDQTKLITTVRNAVEHGRLSLRVTQLEREAEGIGYPGIVGSSAAMKRVFRQIDRLAVSDVTVLIHGESGTGKELVAKAIHTSSSRQRKPFVAVNLTAVPENLLESELFGHEKGSFTGAATRRIGRFEEADGGTLFLDEIGELSATVQAKLLRVLQERSFQRVGGSFQVQSDFRLLTATHRNLADDVKTGRFREDLFFRLAVFELELPPLRKRKEDIAALAQSFIREHRVAMGSAAKCLSMAALDVLAQHSWPGNVRELQNVMQRALVVAEHEEIRPEDLPERIRHVGSFAPVKQDQPEPAAASAVPETPDTLEEASKRLLIAAMMKHEGNASAVMRELNVGRTRFYRMLKKFDLEGRIEEIRHAGRPGA
jgi:DNA-binding NtrC family response regulator